MKNLKTFAVMAALMGATHGARAVDVTEEFMPTRDEGSIQGLALVNNHLMVKSNNEANVGSVKTPYMFVNLGTNDFAKAGFTFEEMANTNAVALHDGKIYTIRNNNETVFQFTVNENPELSGLRSTAHKFQIPGAQSFVTIGDQLYIESTNGLYAVNGDSIQKKIDFDNPGTSYTDAQGREYYTSDYQSLFLHDPKFKEQKDKQLVFVSGDIKSFRIFDKEKPSMLILTEKNKLYYVPDTTVDQCILVNQNITVPEGASIGFADENTAVIKTESGMQYFNIHSAFGKTAKSITPGNPEIVFHDSVTTNNLTYSFAAKQNGDRKTLLRVKTR